MQMKLSGIPLYVRVDDSLHPDEALLIGASAKPDMIQVVSSKAPRDLIEFGFVCTEMREGEMPEGKVLGIRVEVSNPETGNKVGRELIF